MAEDSACCSVFGVDILFLSTLRVTKQSYGINLLQQGDTRLVSECPYYWLFFYKEFCIEIFLPNLFKIFDVQLCQVNKQNGNNTIKNQPYSKIVMPHLYVVIHAQRIKRSPRDRLNVAPSMNKPKKGPPNKFRERDEHIGEKDGQENDQHESIKKRRNRDQNISRSFTQCRTDFCTHIMLLCMSTVAQ
ncbi:hypothetical protein Atc_1237 [Acidithiobacillus caldus SM-1]|uniref:Uncharacterized protein n=1 Tax=Acidithiobacillus caldus (strain SM-1) TaxID=990288 RepID=F9ZMX7_ACICS|nr:hypothetical protein Atc_1237 [Acidithiobacillus caldus SM-1]